MSKKLVVAGSIVFIGFDALIGCLSKILWQRPVLTWYSRQITLCIKQLSLTHSFFSTRGNNYHSPTLFFPREETIITCPLFFPHEEINFEQLGDFRIIISVISHNIWRAWKVTCLCVSPADITLKVSN